MGVPGHNPLHIHMRSYLFLSFLAFLDDLFVFLVFLGWNHGLGSLVSVLLLVIETLCVPVDAGCDLDGKLWVRDSLYIMSL